MIYKSKKVVFINKLKNTQYQLKYCISFTHSHNTNINNNTKLCLLSCAKTMEEKERKDMCVFGKQQKSNCKVINNKEKKC